MDLVNERNSPVKRYTTPVSFTMYGRLAIRSLRDLPTENWDMSPILVIGPEGAGHHAISAALASSPEVSTWDSRYPIREGVDPTWNSLAHHLGRSEGRLHA